MEKDVVNDYVREIPSSVGSKEMPLFFEELHNGEHCVTCKNNGTKACIRVRKKIDVG